MNGGEPLRVLVIRGVDGPGGGADSIVLRNAAQVDPRRITMRVCFFRHVQDRLFDLDRRAEELGIDCHLIPHRGPLDRGMLPQLEAQVREFRPALLHSHDYKANYFATRLAYRHDLPRLATSHGWTGNHWRERLVYYPADKWLLRSFDGVIAVSNEIRDELQRWGVPAQRTHVLLNGVDPQAFQPDEALRRQARAAWGYDEHDWIIGGVGRVEQQKRFDLLLEAFAQVLAAEPRARLLVAGDGSLLESLRQEVAQRGLEPFVRLAGHCPRMHEVYCGLDLLAQSSDYEGTPTVVVEAMACGVPVVATDAGGTRQLLDSERQGLIVPCGRPDLLAAAILRLRREPEARSRGVREARQRVEEQLTYARRTERLVQLYESLGARRRERG
jgi:glycosyltransferase involved in cell wall biosynthesis